MGRQRPGSVDRAMQLLGALLLLASVVAVLTVVLEDEIVRAWAEGNASARSILAHDGLEALKAEPITPAFVPVVLVLFVVMVLLIAVLAAFFRSGHHWARVTLSVTVVLVAVSTLAILRTRMPSVFSVLSVVSVVLEVALLWFLWHRDTTAYVTGAWHRRRAAQDDRLDDPQAPHEPAGEPS
ncbi:hypothetical protein [Nocardioides ferulae]|uniref:hypothetical protein n=1 Tax=Nocardioides ferulae TaxID=2340821 RepID=UPI000EADA570|nr:hypothetical protein [Nocardioides ferulae]